MVFYAQSTSARRRRKRRKKERKKEIKTKTKTKQKSEEKWGKKKYDNYGTIAFRRDSLGRKLVPVQQIYQIPYANTDDNFDYSRESQALDK